MALISGRTKVRAACVRYSHSRSLRLAQIIFYKPNHSYFTIYISMSSTVSCCILYKIHLHLRTVMGLLDICPRSHNINICAGQQDMLPNCFQLGDPHRDCVEFNAPGVSQESSPAGC